MTEEWGGRHWRRTALMVAVLSLAFFLVLGIWPQFEGPTVDLRRDAGRRATDEIREDLRRVVGMVESMDSCTPVGVRARKRAVVDLLQVRVRSYLQDLECELYPVLDRQAGGSTLFTGPLRLEDAVMVRWIEELDEKAARPYSDTSEFSRRVYALLGLLEARLELAEKLLLPLHDRALSPEEIRAGDGSFRTQRG